MRDFILGKSAKEENEGKRSGKLPKLESRAALRREHTGAETHLICAVGESAGRAAF